MPKHYKARISMKLFKIDSWNYEQFYIKFDSTTFKTYKFNTIDGTEICGDDYCVDENAPNQYCAHDMLIPIDEEFDHRNSTLHITLVSDLNEHPDFESFGIREYQFILILVQLLFKDFISKKNSLILLCNTLEMPFNLP